MCVVSLEEINVTPDSVPYSQCREVRTVASPASNMDKITIAASAAICGTIFVAVIVFIAASRYVLGFSQTTIRLLFLEVLFLHIRNYSFFKKVTH